MNENIDLTKILKGCPKGTKLYSPIFGEVRFEEMYEGNIKVEEDWGLKAFRWDGTYLMRDNAECLLFPSKEQRDWSKFERFWDKPKVEKFDPHTLQPFDRVLAKDGVSSWIPTFFGFLIDPADDFYTDNEVAVCNDYAYKQVIPYNDDTKYLVGTSDDCPDFYKWWEE